MVILGLHYCWPFFGCGAQELNLDELRELMFSCSGTGKLRVFHLGVSLLSAES